MVNDADRDALVCQDGFSVVVRTFAFGAFLLGEKAFLRRRTFVG
jgi:hypothetical protein